MPLSSFHFLFSLPFMLAAYWLLPERFQRIILLLSSVIVYFYAGWWDLALLFVIVFTNWLFHKIWPINRMARFTAIALNLGLLAWFKYRVFLGLSSSKDFLIPLGISFYVFQLISYQVEIYKKILTTVPGFGSMFLYIFFFPHHQAGPIMRPSKFLHCFDAPRSWFSSRFTSGLLLLLWGLAKKVWIADVIAPSVDRGFTDLAVSHGQQANLPFLAVCYGIQIYADFSGYSDMAVGIARMFGFKLDRNFHQPYLAINPSDFWRRWHVTLSSWLRDHLYLPLGGNRSGELRTLLNLMVVMLLGGLWHGASWAFVLWGGIHAVLLIIHRILGPRTSLPAWVSFPMFQSCVFLAWLPFRAGALGDLATAFPQAKSWVGMQTIAAILLAAGMVAFSWAEQKGEEAFPRILRGAVRMPRLAFYPAFAVFLYLVLIGAGHATTFIYQRF